MKKYLKVVIPVIAVIVIAVTVVLLLPPKQSDFSFDLYSEFAKENDDAFYIAQTTADDIAGRQKDALRWAEGSVLVIGQADADPAAMESIAASFGGEICGYIEQIDFYQLQLDPQLEYDELLNICETLEAEDIIIDAHVDVYDHFPVEGTTMDKEAAPWQAMLAMGMEDDSFAFVNALEIADYHDAMQSVSVGVLDYPVDYTHEDLDAANANDYSVDFLYEERFAEYAHGTRVASVIAAEQNNGIGIDGLCPTAELYSYNASNQTAAYRTAAIVRMIAQQKTRVLNFSIGYPTQISVSAYLGNENAREYVSNEADYYTAVFNKLLDSGYDFLICQAAGNENTAVMKESSKSYFGYEPVRNNNGVSVDALMDARWSFFTSAIEDARVKEHILVVGACDTLNQLGDFSNVGERVDLAAPGVMVVTLYPENGMIPSNGTSIAAPFVSGTAACVYAVNPDLDAAEVKNIIVESCDTTVGGYPVLNAGAAVAAAARK